MRLSAILINDFEPFIQQAMKFEFSIDRGGTFTDVYAKCPNGKVVITKLLSNDPDNYKDAPSEAIRRIIGDYRGKPFQKDELIDGTVIKCIRMGTTVATNALLERKGERFALVITEGFRDLLFIGDQSRPDIFDLKALKPEVLYDEVVEAEERVLMHNEKCQLKELQSCQLITGESGEKVIIEKPLNENKLRVELESVRSKGIVNLAVVFAHSTAYSEHEKIVERIARELAFEYISLSSKVMPMVKLVHRGLTACVNSYLTPHIQRYVASFASAFKNGLTDLPVLFMQSDGGLTPVDSFLGSRAILSGPAGGVVGYERTTRGDLEMSSPIIGFDMGGTSTDVSRFDQVLEHTFESKIAGVPLKSLQLDISTVAAGGGSRLLYRSGLFVVGPESVGAFPGPVCYRNGTKLAVTDANIILGRILPEFFPACFGPMRDQPLDKEASLREFTNLTKLINSDRSLSKQLTPYEVALGFIKVANETMCRPIRAITEGKGFNTKDHILTCFGGAGGQHACAVAKSLNIKAVFIHKYAGILSALGMAVADVIHEEQEPVACSYDESNYGQIDDRIKKLATICKNSLLERGFQESSIKLECYLNMRYDKTDYTIMCLGKESDHFGNFCETGYYREAFEERYKREFGFLVPDKTILVDDVRVRGISISDGGEELKMIEERNFSDRPEKVVDCYFDKVGFVKCNVYLLSNLAPGTCLAGPCLIVQGNSVILVEHKCSARITSHGNVLIDIQVDDLEDESMEDVDPITLSIFSHRFMSIAEQMGRVLQRAAVSTNIKERLDFSCALFGPDGGLVSNAPHIPVHLGSMQEAVEYQLKNCPDISPGDVILTNHPCAGGSHLPDLTVITPVFDVDSKFPVFFVANRGHHSDIGGITPGSMPANSTSLPQEGAVFVSFKIVEKNAFQEEKLIEHLKAPGAEVGNSGSRNIRDNINDLKAQIAANQRGIALCSELIAFYGLKKVQNYMKHIQRNAASSVREMLRNFANKLNSCELFAEDYMDDGTCIKLKVTIDKENGKALFDFTGSGLEVYGNTNAPRAITLSAIIYCLRCLVGHDIPLNQGCLLPVDIIIPKESILWPSDTAAVVGGNVLTSQRIVDVILKAFKACAASQGCMNNITFGDQSMGYYETVAGGSGKPVKCG